MKKVVSLSLGSSRRDKTVRARFWNEDFEIARIGTNGDQALFVKQLAELDGTVDAIGFGGMDRYLWSNNKRYEFSAAKKLLAGAVKTPVLDGSGLKNTLEREAVKYLAEKGIVDFAHTKTLMVCGVDRFGMSEALAQQGGPLYFGDLMFSLDIPIPIKSAAQHRVVAKTLLPLITKMPLAMLYPTGEKQNTIVPKWGDWYKWADVVAGDYLFIGRFLPTPESGFLKDKIILTNTTTEADEPELARRGAKMLITTTPNFEGRSFGTNVMEAVLVAANNGKSLTEVEYLARLQELNWTPSVRPLQAGKIELAADDILRNEG